VDIPRDPNFVEKAGPVLDLYAGRWEGKLLEPGDMVISADAKPSIQARKRIHPSAPPAPGRGQRIEHEYDRMGALTYFDVHRGKASIKRLQGRWPTLILVHLAIHASWLNQVEIYHSIIQLAFALVDACEEGCEVVAGEGPVKGSAISL
jgi:hypothetical protein